MSVGARLLCIFWDNSCFQVVIVNVKMNRTACFSRNQRFHAHQVGKHGHEKMRLYSVCVGRRHDDPWFVATLEGHHKRRTCSVPPRRKCSSVSTSIPGSDSHTPGCQVQRDGSWLAWVCWGLLCGSPNSLSHRNGHDGVGRSGERRK